MYLVLQILSNMYLFPACVATFCVMCIEWNFVLCVYQWHNVEMLGFEITLFY